jgi:hypothetical protein
MTNDGGRDLNPPHLEVWDAKSNIMRDVLFTYDLNNAP